jgi:uncharacterized phage-like protein YoqJ
VEIREAARMQKDFQKSDQLRDQLKQMGVQLLDKEKVWKSLDGKIGVWVCECVCVCVCVCVSLDEKIREIVFYCFLTQQLFLLKAIIFITPYPSLASTITVPL